MSEERPHLATVSTRAAGAGTPVARDDVDLAAILGAQHPGGAYPASAGFSQYGHSWLRDGSFIAHAADRAGQHASAERFHHWVARSIAAQAPAVRELIARRRAGKPISEFDFLPARYTLDGHWQQDGWPNFQLDGYGQWLWSLAGHLVATGQTSLSTEFKAAVAVVIDYLEEFWDEPCYDCWEEFRSQLHTATLASISAGLGAISRFVPRTRAAGEAARALILSECVADGHFVKHIGNAEVDASLLWLATPFGVVAEDDPVMLATVEKIERDLEVDGGVSRYRADTYYGGGEWVILSASLGWYRARRGDLAGARVCLDWIDKERRPDGSLPEQVPRKQHLERFFEHWTRNWGPSASPLVWSHAMTLCLRLELAVI